MYKYIKKLLIIAVLGAFLVGPGTISRCHNFNVNLKLENIGTEIDALQTALTAEGFNVSDDEKLRDSFGESTASAVSGFQKKYKDEILTPRGFKYGTGYVDSATRVRLNELYGCKKIQPSAEWRDKLTVALEILSDKWDSNAVDIANGILSNTSYSSSDFKNYFQFFFSAHPFTDALRNYLSYPTIWWFSDIAHQNLQEAFSVVITNKIDKIFTAYRPGNALSSALKENPILRNDLKNHLLFFSDIAFHGKQFSAVSRNTAYNFFKNQITNYPLVFRKEATININTQPWLAPLRARIYKTMRDLKPFNVNEFVIDTGFWGEYANIAKKHGLLVLDNNGFDSGQIGAIKSLLDNIPANLHNTTSISQHELLGNVIDASSYAIWMDFRGSSGVNIFKEKLNVMENQFPSDISPIEVPIFNSALQHEINHIVDGFYIENNPLLKNRKAELIARAGTTTMQYLRSMIPAGYFVDAPQEFFASISNQYLSDSFHTLELGLQRFDNGYKEPINQFLFFTDVYSKKGTTTPFYKLDKSGNYTATNIALARNNKGQIISLTVGNKKYSFELDQNGNILNY